MASSGNPPPPGREILTSWKEVASWFNVEIRTVQNWERDLGLPIHRLPGKKGRVWALPEELEVWRQGKPPDAPQPPAHPRCRLYIALAAIGLLILAFPS